MVANSRATEARASADSKGSSSDGSAPSGYSYLVCGPVGEERNQHRLTKMLGSAADHLSTAGVTFQDPEEPQPSELPFVRTASLSSSWYPERD